MHGCCALGTSLSVVHAEEDNYAKVDLQSEHLGSESQGFSGLTSNGNFLSRALSEFNWLTGNLA